MGSRESSFRLQHRLQLSWIVSCHFRHSAIRLGIPQLKRRDIDSNVHSIQIVCDIFDSEKGNRSVSIKGSALPHLDSNSILDVDCVIKISGKDMIVILRSSFSSRILSTMLTEEGCDQEILLVGYRTGQAEGGYQENQQNGNQTPHHAPSPVTVIVIERLVPPGKAFKSSS